jgi:hypothetical protein
MVSFILLSINWRLTDEAALLFPFSFCPEFALLFCLMLISLFLRCCNWPLGCCQHANEYRIERHKQQQQQQQIISIIIIIKTQVEQR